MSFEASDGLSNFSVLTSTSNERMPEYQYDVDRVQQCREEETPAGRADERDRVERQAAGQRRHAEQPEYEHQFLTAVPRHRVGRFYRSFVIRVGVRPEPREQRQQPALHADHELSKKSDESEDA